MYNHEILNVPMRQSMQINDVKTYIAHAAKIITKHDIVVGGLGSSGAVTAENWPAHPSGYGSWPWAECMRRDKRDPTIHYLQMSMAVGGQSRMYAAVKLDIPGPGSNKKYVSLKLLASDPSGGPWKGSVMPSFFLGMLLAWDADPVKRFSELWVVEPAPGLVPTYVGIANSAGLKLKSNPAKAGRIEFTFM